MLDQYGPDPLQNAFLCPALKPAVHRRVVAELHGQFVPLAACAHLVDDAVEARPPACRGTTRALSRPKTQQNWLDDRPQRVVHYPNCVQRLGHESLLAQVGQ